MSKKLHTDSSIKTNIFRLILLLVLSPTKFLQWFIFPTILYVTYRKIALIGEHCRKIAWSLCRNFAGTPKNLNLSEICLRLAAAIAATAAAVAGSSSNNSRSCCNSSYINNCRVRQKWCESFEEPPKVLCLLHQPYFVPSNSINVLANRGGKNFCNISKIKKVITN